MPKVDKEFLNNHYNEINETFKVYGLKVFVHFEKRNIVLYIENKFNQDFDISRLNNYFTDLCNRYKYVNNIKIVDTKLFDQIIQPHKDSIQFEEIRDNKSDKQQIENSSKLSTAPLLFNNWCKPNGDNTWVQPNSKISPVLLRTK